jgi:hypothetical protein
MGMKFLKGTGILIAVYLVLSHATEFGLALGAGSNTYIGGVKTLQGR